MRIIVHPLSVKVLDSNKGHFNFNVWVYLNPLMNNSAGLHSFHLPFLATIKSES